MRTIVVTGGSRGIGLGIARALAAAGYQVIAVARRQTPDLAAAPAAGAAAAPGAATAAGAAAGAATAPDGQGVIRFRACDLADLPGLPGFVRALRDEFGALYGLVNNAGLGTSGILATMPDSQIEQLVRLNVLSPVLLTKYVVRAMMADGGSRIVNIGSIVASSGYNGLSVYSATKAALGGFTRSLARELGPLGITVNAVAPGFIDTDMTQELNPGQRAQIARRSALRRMAQTEDVAAAVAYLLSDAARNVTGTVLTVDAGNTA
jgi:3-oxoacyl-[acyl-carrier protein] reductase